MKIPKARELPSGSWFIQLRLGGESISITEEDEDLCIAKAMAIKTGLIEAKRRPGDITVGKAMDDYINERSNILSPTTIRSYKHIRKFRFQGIIDEKAGSLTKSAIQAEINREATTIAYKTLKNAVGLLKAATSEHLTCDISRLTLPQKTKRDIPVYGTEALRKLFKAIEGDPAEAAVLLAAWLGLRRSEILGLKYEDFNREAGTVAIQRARVPDEKNNLVEKTTKTLGSTRVLPCPQIIFDKVGEGEGYIYDGHKQNYLRARLDRICKASGLPNMTIHGLRHTNASIMLALNIPDKYAMERGGWSSDQVMKGVYQHTIDEHREAANKAVDSYFKAIAEGD